MDVHLERKLRLVTEPEHKGQYSWAINEIGDSETLVCQDQIPWEWSLSFTATEVVLRDQTTVREAREGNRRLQKAETIHGRSIRATLRPGHPNDGSLKPPKYRMFGTDRIIDSFDLEILPLGSEAETEECISWGFVSYTSEIDFRQETVEDCVGFYLSVKPSTFERYADRIASGAADEIILTVHTVSGFYSDWSLSVSTDEVKVLADGKDHIIEEAEGISFEIPRLGPVGEAQLQINMRKALNSKPVENAPRSEELRQDDRKNQSIPRDDTRLVLSRLVAEVSKSTKLALGLLVILIIVVWIK